MGKVEKIVVLGVLLAIVSILIVSLKGGLVAAGGPPSAQSGSEDEAPMPVAELSAAVAIQAADPLRASQRAVPDSDQGPRTLPAALLSAETPRLLRLPRELPAPALDESWDIVTTAGLSPLPFDKEAMLRTAAEGDSWASLSQEYYGDSRHSALLRRNNEGVDPIEVGQKLLIPLYDLATQGGEIYEVSDGDSLWRIANKVYGKGHRWEEIYRANRDVLETPDHLHKGMRLRIP